MRVFFRLVLVGYSIGMQTREDAKAEQDDEDGERFDVVVKRAAKAGYELREVPTGYVLRRDNSSRHCGDLATVHALLRGS